MPTILRWRTAIPLGSDPYYALGPKCVITEDVSDTDSVRMTCLMYTWCRETLVNFGQ